MQHKNIAVLCHITGFIGGWIFPFMNILAPLIIWLFNRKKEMVDRHGREAIRFQISKFVYLVILGFCMAISLLVAGDAMARYFVVQTIMGVVLFILSIIGAIVLMGCEIFFIFKAVKAASEGKDYRYPISIRML